jgi:hypothetical protein
MDDTDWYCQYCQQLHDDIASTSAATPTLDDLQQALPLELRWHKVDWQPSPEPLDKIQQMLELQPEKHNHLLQKLTELKRNQAAPPTKRRRTPGYDSLQLTNLQQQGIYLHAIQEQRRYDVTHGQDIRKLLTINPNPINPQTDINSTSGFQTCIRKVESRHERRDYTHEVACIHKPDGSTPYTLPVNRLKLLYDAYSHARESSPTKHSNLSAGTFEAHVYQLLTRYKDGALCAATTSNTITATGERTTPNTLFEALQTAIAALSERCSSPLNFHASMQTYYSPFEADQLFASSGDATKCRWTGSSLATPEAHPAEVHKFVKHAIESAKAEAHTATLTLLLIPASTEFKNPGYLKLMRANSAYCKPVMRIPASKLCMETQPKYMLNTSQQAKPTGDMLLVEIGNQAGFEQYSTARTDHAHTAFLADVLQALNSALPAPARINAAAVRTYCTRAQAILNNNNMPQQRTRAAAKVRKLPADTSTRICNTSTVPTPLPPQYVNVQFPLKYNWRQLAYTDGSYIDP